MVGPAGPGARGGCKRRLCSLKKNLSDCRSLLGGNPLLFSSLFPHTTPPLLGGGKGNAGEELTAARDLKMKYVLDNF